MLKPRALKSGDRIAVVAPASPFDREAFDRGLDELRALGFEPLFDQTVFERSGYVAGAAALRADAILTAWNDPGVTALIGVRGGYGSVQVLQHLDRERLRAHPKALIGYSDLTSLLVFLGTGCQIVCFHGPMLERKLAAGADGYDRRSFLQALTMTEPLGVLTGPHLESIRPGAAAGPLFGGTLTPIVGSLGTPFAFDPPSGSVLFLDEVSERPYRLDRMITQLRLSGIVDRAAAIVFGECPGCDEPGGTYTARGAVAAALEDFGGPVLFGLPSGHTISPALTLPFGVRARVDTSPAPRLVIQEAAVE
ncbi:MAG: LD-carboxypeptidase [Acidobacteria bacterium]|nr:LD-carboxypeptidase [Acidobacteriota bacterium]MBI3262940.1 LD-carboxypeptidase [Acidobacteriota bacterium]